jgi:hypothetical protein
MTFSKDFARLALWRYCRYLIVEAVINFLLVGLALVARDHNGIVALIVGIAYQYGDPLLLLAWPILMLIAPFINRSERRECKLSCTTILGLIGFLLGCGMMFLLGSVNRGISDAMQKLP